MKRSAAGPNGDVPRLAKPSLETALKCSRVTWLGGPRQAGKTTLAKAVAQKDMPFVSLDNPASREFAQSDPVGFLKYYDCAVIDEAQIAPDLVKAIKIEVDRDRRKSRFLLTGSANLLTIPQVSESLAGRMSLLQLLPLSQSEIMGGSGTFLDAIFAGELPKINEEVSGPDLVELVLAGGLPEVLLERETGKPKRLWYNGYIETILQRDLRDIAQIEKPRQMGHLLRLLALFSGKTVNFLKIGEALAMNHVTTKRYMQLLEDLYFFRTLPSWQTNSLKRSVKAPKLYFLDSGLLAHLLKASPEKILRNRTVFGAIAETFVFSELAKQATWSDERYEFLHMRDRNGREVDLVIEDEAGNVVGIEVKASANVSPSDFSGLRVLEKACGDRFVRGIILCEFHQPISYKEKFIVLPISSLWS